MEKFDYLNPNNRQEAQREKLKDILVKSKTIQQLMVELVDQGIVGINRSNGGWTSTITINESIANILWGGEDNELLKSSIHEVMPDECGFNTRVVELLEKAQVFDDRHAEQYEADFEKEVQHAQSIDDFLNIIKSYGGIRIKGEASNHYYTYGDIKNNIVLVTESPDLYMHKLEHIFPEQYGVAKKVGELLNKDML